MDISRPGMINYKSRVSGQLRIKLKGWIRDEKQRAHFPVKSLGRETVITETEMHSKQSRETILALVLAAGSSRRMGDFKPLLPFRGRTLIENSVESVLSGGAESAVVVTGYRAADVEQTIFRAFEGRVQFVRNEAYAKTDMKRSIQLGVSAMPKCGAFFLLPGDMPLISQDTFRRLLLERARYPAPVIFPTLEGRRRHPPLIDARVIPSILAFDREGGLRELWKQYESEIISVPVDDVGVCIDVDTPDDYEKVLRMDDSNGRNDLNGQDQP